MSQEMLTCLHQPSFSVTHSPVIPEVEGAVIFYSPVMLEGTISPAVKTIRVEENAALSRSMAGFVAFI